MTLTITVTDIASDVTQHTATRCITRWIVSWLPDRPLDRNQAISAMSIAELVAEGLEPGDPDWPLIDEWASELGLTGPDAVGRVSEATVRMIEGGA